MVHLRGRFSDISQFFSSRFTVKKKSLGDGKSMSIARLYYIT